MLTHIKQHLMDSKLCLQSHDNGKRLIIHEQIVSNVNSLVDIMTCVIYTLLYILILDLDVYLYEVNYQRF